MSKISASDSLADSAWTQLAKSIHSEDSVAARRLKKQEQLGLQSIKKGNMDISAILAPIFENFWPTPSYKSHQEYVKNLLDISSNTRDIAG